MGATSPHPRQHRPRRRVPSRLQATGISKFMPSDDGDDNKGGRSQRGKGAEAAEQDMREMADEVTGAPLAPMAGSRPRVLERACEEMG